MHPKIKYTLYLLGLSLLWFVFFSCVLQFSNKTFSLNGDEGSYFNAAQNFYTSFKIDDSRPIVISAIFSVPFWFSNDISTIFNFVLTINMLCWLATILLIFNVLNNFLSDKKAFFMACIFMFCSGNVALLFKFLSETTFVFFIVLSIYFIQKHFQTTQSKFLNLAITSLVLSSLIKPLAVFLLLIVIAFHLKKSKQIILSLYFIPVLISFSLLFYQMKTLEKQFGNFTISYIDSFTYYNYLGTRAHCLKNNIAFKQCDNERFRYFCALSNQQQRKVANQDFVNQIKNNSIFLAQAFAFNIITNSSKASVAISDATTKNQNSKLFFKALSKIQNIILTIIGLIFCLKLFYFWKTSHEYQLILASFFVTIFLLSGISSDQGDRFHTVLFPIVVLMLGAFIRKKL